MTFGVCHVKQVHITPNSRFLAHSLTVIDLGLVISAAAEEVCSTWIERERSYRVAIKRLKVLKWLQITVHRREVPDFHSVIQPTRDHLRPLTIYAESLH